MGPAEDRLARPSSELGAHSDSPPGDFTAYGVSTSDSAPIPMAVNPPVETVTDVVAPLSHEMDEMDVDAVAPGIIPSTEYIALDMGADSRVRRMPGHLSIPPEARPSNNPIRAAGRSGHNRSICIFDRADGKLLQHVEHGSGMCH